jgi:phage shock protein A
MEEKVLALEAAAEVSNEMAQTMMSRALSPSFNESDGVSDIELQFRMLESSDNVDKELEKLKAKVLPPASKKIAIAGKAPAKSFDHLSY